MLSDIGVVVLSYGLPHTESPLVEALLAEGVPRASLVVVHNTDGAVAPGTCRHPPVAVIHPQGNLGYAGGMNAGIDHFVQDAPGWILLLTDDARLWPGCVTRLCSVAREAPGVGILGPELRRRSTGTPFSVGGIVGRFGSRHHRIESPPTDGWGIAPCDWLDGAALLINREVLHLGGMEERYFMYVEDAEFCLRATAAGWRVGCVLGAVAEQEPGNRRRPASYWYLITRNGLDYQRRVGGWASVVAGLGRVGWVLLVHARRGMRRSLPASERRISRARAAGVRAGVRDYVLKHWGPPPHSITSLDAVSED